MSLSPALVIDVLNGVLIAVLLVLLALREFLRAYDSADFAGTFHFLERVIRPLFLLFLFSMAVRMMNLANAMPA